MKKYYIKDDDDREYEVIESDISEDVDETPDVEEVTALSEEDIDALKRLAAVADQLIALVQTQDASAEEPVEEPVEEPLTDEDPEEVDEVDETEETEEVVDTCKDSKRSFGALEKKKIKADDSLNDEVSDAWAKRFGGK